MPQHACIAIGIDRYRYMQPLRYALEDAREFHAAIAQIDAHETGAAIANQTSQETSSQHLNTISDWSPITTQNGHENGHENGNGNGSGSITPPIATLTPFTIAPPDDTKPDLARHRLITETSPQVGDRSTYPTREAILHALYHWTRDTVTPDQTLWCFFSGYGLEVDGIDYLLPIEGNPNRLEETAIPIETVFDALAAAPTDRVVLILDINRPTSADRDSDIGLQTYTLAKARNIPTILSCQPHQRSYETRDLRHGLFSAILLEALRHRKCPTLESLDRYLTDRVPELCDLHLQPTQTPLLAMGSGVPSPFVLFDAAVSAKPDANASNDRKSGDEFLNFPNLTDLDLDSTRVTDPDITIPSASQGQNRAELPQTGTIQAEAISSDIASISDVEARSLLGMGSSLMVWLGLFGSVLGLGVWLNGSMNDSAIEPDRADYSEPTQSLTDPSIGSSNSASNSTANPAPEMAAPLTAGNETDSAQNNTPIEPSDPTAIPSNPPPRSDASSPMPVMEPSAIASMHSLQASPLDAAIAHARRLTPDDPGYDDRDQNIKRWGTTIFEIAQSRADRGQWMMAIAAARLVPPELTDLQSRTDRSIQWWTQAQVNEQMLTAARKMIEPNQASSYWRAIERLRTIKKGQPFDDMALNQVETWAADMVAIARQRAANGQTAAAIQAAQLVPRQTAAYADARREMARWQSVSP
jgi:uncharacterized caspase-like protein